MSTFKIPPIELGLYYGAGIVGKLFLLGGMVFLVGLWMTTSNSDPDPEFMKIFGAVTAGALLTGVMLLLLPLFMQRPDPAKYMPEILDYARVFRVLGCAALIFLAIHILPFAAVIFILTDTRDCLPWQAVPETGIVQSCQETGVLVNDQPQYCYQIQVKTPDGDIITPKSYSIERYDEKASVPLERCGSLYRLRGSYFGIGAPANFILLAALFLDVCAFIIVARPVWKLHGFIKHTATEPAESLTDEGLTP